MRRTASTWPRDEQGLEKRLQSLARDLHAPRGFSDRVMNAVYRESLVPVEPNAAPPTALRMYRRIAFSFMVTAIVLAASLLVPRGAYSTLIAAGEGGVALGTGSSAVVQGVLLGAANRVQGALGEQTIEGGEQ